MMLDVQGFGMWKLASSGMPATTPPPLTNAQPRHGAAGMVQTPPPPAAPMPMGAAPPGAVGYPPDAGGYMPAAGPYGGPQQPAMAGGFQEGMMGLAGRPTAPGE